jgi:hypothetical protein
MKLQLKKLLRNNFIMYLLILLVGLSCCDLKKAKSIEQKPKNTDTITRGKAIYHDNPISYEDSLNNAIFEIKHRISAVHFYETQTTLDSKILDSIYNSGFIIDDSTYQQAKRNYIKKMK